MTTFLGEPEDSPALQALYDKDLADGYVMNLSRAWGHHPELKSAFFDLFAATASAAGLSMRDRGVLVAAMASTMGDAYCSIAWGNKLAAESSPEVARAVLTGTDDGLDQRERVLAAWARTVTADPNTTTPDDVAALRSVGYDDAQVLAITAFVAMRNAFSRVNDALGAIPDDELLAKVPAEVAETVTWGRSPG